MTQAIVDDGAHIVGGDVVAPIQPGACAGDSCRGPTCRAGWRRRESSAAGLYQTALDDASQR